MEQIFFLGLPGLIGLYLAVAIDILLGDGDYALHPVRLMGALISFAEKRARASGLPLKTAGIFTGIFLIGGSFLTTLAFFTFIKDYSLFFYSCLSAVFIYFCICLKCLGDEAKTIYLLLKKKRINEAREKIAFLVSRETSQMDEGEICRSVIETVSENLVDGVISPFFYGAVLGPPGAVSFKMASTLDSMIGYKNKKYKDLGYFSAKIDDFLNFIPARITYFFIILAGFLFFGKNPLITFKKGLKYVKCSQSPNSGYPEAAFAVVLGIRLGGPTVYDGKLSILPFLNEKGQRPNITHVKQAIDLMYYSAFLFYTLPGLIFLILSS